MKGKVIGISSRKKNILEIEVSEELEILAPLKDNYVNIELDG